MCYCMILLCIHYIRRIINKPRENAVGSATYNCVGDKWADDTCFCFSGFKVAESIVRSTNIIMY